MLRWKVERTTKHTNRTKRSCTEKRKISFVCFVVYFVVSEGVTMTDQPEKLDLTSHDVAEDKRQELLRLFPEVCTEGGKVDFERLRLALGEAVDVGKERYGMNWPGKADCFKAIQTPSLGTLRPCPEESWPPKPFASRGDAENAEKTSADSARTLRVRAPREPDFNTSENLIIEGDNLEVLKLLQKSYLGKVKMIYIDPPYNTGNDFIYPDNYTESLQTYLEYTGQVDAEGRKFGTNTDTDGRFHSKWLNMMYPRLYLARNLLREDGVIFISVDDGELAALRAVLDMVFGEDDFICCFTWQTKKGAQGMQTKHMVVTNHEYVLCYARNPDKFSCSGIERTEEGFSNPDNDSRGPWKRQYLQRLGQGLPQRRVVNPNNDMVFEFETPYSQEKIDNWIAENRIIFPASKDSYPARKEFLSEYETNKQLVTNLGLHATKASTEELYGLFEGEKIFANPKPPSLISFLIDATCNHCHVVLDFFAGSGTTAHAVLDLNKQDGGNRKFILVQLPEPTGREDYPTIADITKERVRRVIQKIARGDAESAEKKGPDLFSSADSATPREPDLGFRVFKLDESNFKPWDAEAPKDAATLEKQLELHIDHIREGRTDADILYELLLKSGFPLTTPVETLRIARGDAENAESKKKRPDSASSAAPRESSVVYSVAGGALLICLERELTLKLIRAMAERKPKRVVCLDEGFAGKDQLKANAVQIFKTKGVVSFKTV